MSHSNILFSQAKVHIPGGVNSPVRSFGGVDGEPIFIKKGIGPYIIDEDNNRYIDYVGSWGPMILGHAHPKVIDAVKSATDEGLSFGAPTSIEVAMADTICSHVPSIEKIRMVNSGTEATMSAIRLARGFTGKEFIIKFAGCYHGHVDALLVNAGSGALTFGEPSSPGIPKAVTQQTLIAEYNNVDSVTALFKAYPEKIAAVIIEPIAGNMNCVPAKQDFLDALRHLCDEHDSLLIFDEVMTGFRVALGGAQSLYKIQPDLTTLGKVIGGGLPVGAFGGRADIMSHLAPVGAVYQAGTLSGNPIAMTAGIETLNLISQAGFFENLAQKTQALVQGLEEIASNAKIPLTTHAVGGMFGLFFSEEKTITTLEQVQQCNLERFKRFFHAMLSEGNYFAPSAFEAGFMSIAHTEDDISHTLRAAEQVLSRLS